MAFCNGSNNLSRLKDHLTVLDNTRPGNQHQWTITTDVNRADGYYFYLRDIHNTQTRL
jgi:uncharacterized lipoprotein YmbA